ncbi:nucleotidyltransferase family protein [Rhodococcus sp. BP-252]|uniref:Molybdopterin-guanine dinucleotide biosynthesis protein MobA n=1 Tax=Rhodococcoides kyotonense TaxID=398843 RepID=A0A177Y762_9NOCA|nr:MULTISPECIES: nucleotidyltransferase family protein [Rhodococcus]MBY6413813.1 nucleotidyltransferase family protein [Rhodococcus sp. BP-320]MBY6419233.1 nucleotidyltransferase family protein [Rhodococcus sp. BP-321]MBY6424116.1 nucleotidyltransferase family protein [Rhodococcus sp. BP-324]MBY6428614.1 nucleotidyltransferase family protein [Rhodococcus sp. BP-323]MBY6434366.1 nucleotidyltransferase family protein [Rhodococcus sp. BP-322]
MTSDAVGVLLAAGAGTRYGSPKVLAHDGAWLNAAVRALVDGGCGRVLVVLGAASVPVPLGAEAVHAPKWREGLSASLRAGLGAAGDASFAVVHVVDTPDVGSDVVGAVLDAARDAPSHLARAVFDGVPGHPVVFGREHWDDVISTAVGDSGARDFLRGRTDVVAVECSRWATGVDQDYRQ